jgi:hypothetical protein
VTRGEQVLRRTLSIPAAFALEPLPPVAHGAPLTVRWTAAAGAQHYQLDLHGDLLTGLGSAERLTSTEHTFAPVDYVGRATLVAEAVSDSGDAEHQDLVTVRVVRSASVTFEAANESPGELAFAVSGTVRMEQYGTESIFVVTRNGVRTTDAEVWLGQTPLTGNPETGTYELLEGYYGSMFDFGPQELRVALDGQELRRTLSMPGPLTVLSPERGADLRRGDDLVVRWEPSAGATQYTLTFVSATTNGLYMSAWTTALQKTFPQVQCEGHAFLSVAATAVAPDSDTLGLITLERAVTVPLYFDP